MAPVMVGFYVPEDSLFEFFASGVWPASSCALPPGPPDPTKAMVNHALLVVGYDMTFPGNEHWIVKNSWGSGWVWQPVGQWMAGRQPCNALLLTTPAPCPPCTCREEWGENGFASIAMMHEGTYGTCFMYYVGWPTHVAGQRAVVACTVCACS